MKKNILLSLLFLVAANMQIHTIAMEDPNEVSNSVERKIADIGEKRLERKLQLTDPETIVRSEILLEIMNHQDAPYTLETLTKKIGPTIYPLKAGNPQWAYKIPLYKISRNLAVFEADLIDSERKYSTVYIALARDSDLKSSTLNLDILDPKDIDDASNAKSENIYANTHYKVVIEIPKVGNAPSIKIRTLEKSPKGSLIQRVLSGSGINKN